MSRILHRVVESARRVVYGPGYRRARDGAFRRSRGICQLCGKRPATEGHHWALFYPADDEVTADHLTALCCFCHWVATLLRLLDRTGETMLWVVLATARPPRGRRASRRGPRSCGAPELPSAEAPTLDLHALVERCHATLFVRCLGCGHSVRLDSLEHFRRRGCSGSATDLHRLCCCRCRSANWIILGGWPRTGEGVSERRAG